MKPIEIALNCLLLACAMALPASAQTSVDQPAQDVNKVMVNVVYTHSSGIVRLNGIPINTFGGGDYKGGGSGTLFIGNGLTNYGIVGVNTLSVEAMPAAGEPDASTELVVLGAGPDSANALGELDHPLFQKKIAGAGSIQFVVKLRNLPHRLFDDAAPWHGDPNAVLTAVHDLHKAFAERDMKVISAALRPAFDNMEDAKQLGSFDGMMAHLNDSLKGSKVAELPANLKVESFYDGRLFRVNGANGLAPIRAASIKVDADGRPDEFLELGEFWCYRDGIWLPLGD
jgi:hypothetical protein